MRTATGFENLEPLACITFARTVTGMASHHTHVAIGLLSGSLVATSMHLGPGAAALFALSSGGAALLADVDTPDSAVSHAGGVLMKLPFWALRRATIKHRGLSHTLIAGVILSGVVYLLGYLYPSSHGGFGAYWPSRILIPALLAMLAARSVFTFGSHTSKTSRSLDGSQDTTYYTILSRRHRFYLDLLVGAIVTYLGVTLGSTPHYALGLALAVGVGYLSHLLADAVFGGVPLVWPLRPSLAHSSRITFAHFKTGGLFDHLLGWPALLLSIYLQFANASLAPSLMSFFHQFHL